MCFYQCTATCFSSDDPPTWPSAGDSVRIVVADGALEDSFGNGSKELVLEAVTWPGANGILLDQSGKIGLTQLIAYIARTGVAC